MDAAVGEIVRVRLESVDRAARRAVFVAADGETAAEGAGR
ncbi:MAG: hypothetical protein L0J57_07720 [Brachybacterium sp.]|nr:hypothetical protein [Brachybacterium sp.]